MLVFMVAALAGAMLALLRPPRMPRYWLLLAIAAVPQIGSIYGVWLPGMFLVSVTAFWLCRRLQADRAEVSRACASLIRRGFVASRPNPADARSALLDLTRAGQAMFDRIMPVRLALQRELAGALDRREIAVLYRALDKLTRAISEKMAPAATARSIRTSPVTAKKRAPSGVAAARRRSR